MGRQKPVNAHVETVRKATAALRGKKAKVETTKTGSSDVETPGQIVSHDEVMRIHDEKLPRGK